MTRYIRAQTLRLRRCWHESQEFAHVMGHTVTVCPVCPMFGECEYE